MVSYLLQETGSKFLLEDGTGFLLLETSTPDSPGGSGGAYLSDGLVFRGTVEDGGVYLVSSRDSRVYSARVSDEGLFGALVSDSIA